MRDRTVENRIEAKDALFINSWFSVSLHFKFLEWLPRVVDERVWASTDISSGVGWEVRSRGTRRVWIWKTVCKMVMRYHDWGKNITIIS